jgi:uncharacterized protein (DUF1330 family)
MPAYVISRQRIPDPGAEAIRRYREASGPLLERYGGRFIVRGGPIDALEGDAGADRVAVLEFPDAESARSWFHSPEYQEAAALRRSASDADFILVEGVG